MEKNYSFLVIGGGSAGYAAARTAKDYGLTTAIIDGASELGGLCILRGCMPSKTLIESANRYRSLRRAEEFGLRAGEHRVDAPAIIARKRRLIGEFADYRREQLEDGRFDLIRGTASFNGPRSVMVKHSDDGREERIGFRTALIASGSVVSRIPVEGLEESGYWTSDELLEAEDIPDEMIVLGGGAIALEMACYLEGLGRKVTVIQRSNQLLSGSDLDVAKSLEQALASRENTTIFTGTTLKRVSLDPGTGKKTVVFTQGGEEKSATADQIVQALGRHANTGTLRADLAGVELLQDGRVNCSASQLTTSPRIYAAGDVCSPHEVVHLAIEQGEIAAHNAAVALDALSSPFREIDYRLKLYGIFTDPQVATVGLSEAEAESEGRDVISATSPFDDHGKSMVMGETHGFVKMIADAESGEILGAAAVGPEAVELIHELVVAMHFRATVTEFLKIPHYHPTLSEIWLYPAEELSNFKGMR